MRFGRFLCWLAGHAWRLTERGWAGRDFVTYRAEEVCSRCGARRIIENGAVVRRLR